MNFNAISTTIQQREMKNKKETRKTKSLKVATKLLEDNQSFEVKLKDGAIGYINSNDGSAGILYKVNSEGNFIVVDGKWVKW